MYYILGFPHFSMSHTVPLETKKTSSKQNCITEIEFCLILHRKLPGIFYIILIALLIS